MGPGAAKLSWEKPLKKYASQCKYIAALKLGLAASALLYRVLALSALSFVVQICPIPEEARVQERKCLRLLVPGPGNWIPIAAIHNLDVLFGMPTNFPSLAIWGLAAQSRMALTDLDDCWQHKLMISRALMSDDAPLQHRWRDWYYNSIAFTVTEARDQLVGLGLCRSTPSFYADLGSSRKCLPIGASQSGSLQSAIYKLLRKKRVSIDLNSLLRRRLERWSNRGMLTITVGRATGRAERMVQQLQGNIPPCVTAALVRSRLNGWCIARRFQQGRGKCWLSAECSGEDSIEHYACCDWSWHMAKRRLKVEQSPKNIGRFLMLETSVQDDPAMLALNLYAVYNAVNHFRSSGQRGRENAAYHRIGALYTQAALLHTGLARKMRSLWRQ